MDYLDIFTVIYDYAPLLSKCGMSMLSRDLAEYHRRYLKVARPVSEKLYDSLFNGRAVDDHVLVYYTIPRVNELLEQSIKHLRTDIMMIALNNGAEASDKMLCLAADHEFPVVLLYTDHGKYGPVRLLLDYGADPDIILYRAMNRPNKELLRMILKYGAEATAVFDHALGIRDFYMAEIALDYGADIHHENESFLMYAANKHDVEMIKFLKARGANAAAIPIANINELRRQNRIDIVNWLLYW